MGPGYRCMHYELPPCDRELQIVAQFASSGAFYCLFNLELAKLGVPIYISYFV